MTRSALNSGQYRVREAIVSHCNGFTFHKRRMFIAERRVSFLRIFSFWGLTLNGTWRRNAQEAWQDANNDLDLRQPLPLPQTLHNIRGKL